MLNVAVILLTLFNCIAGEAYTANALLPLARTDVSLSLSNSSMLVERIVADPKLFVSQMASADPVVIRNVIGMLQLLIQSGTTAVTKFERDVTDAKADEDAKIKIHDDLSSLVENLTKTEENLVAEAEEKRLAGLSVAATIVTKTEEKRVAGLDKIAAVAHHTSMVAERDANVPDLTTDNTAISSVISILEGLLPVAPVGDQNCESAVGTGWILVRRTLQRCHAATDQLNGTAIYGTYSTDPTIQSSFSIAFDSKVPGWNEMLFSTGTCNHWMVMTKSAVIGEYYSHSARNILRSHVNPNPYTALEYRRNGHGEDPWLQPTATHSQADALYCAGNYGAGGSQSLQFNGLNVYIRNYAE